MPVGADIQQDFLAADARSCMGSIAMCASGPAVMYDERSAGGTLKVSEDFLPSQYSSGSLC